MSDYEPRYDVVWPLGRRVVGEVVEQERPAELGGRTVAYLWDELFRGPEMFEVISEVARDRFDDVEFVGWEEFGNFHASAAEEKRVLEALPELLRSHRVDLVVAAVGA
ncbi:hypothetical protein SAMN05216207_100371 [Pseudonocardia ammonioxydans]|uniref:UGSC-like domain-containing protein n=1 Tax=Pseudonocardia ammonioxydans TaxID=260086 RepID=A0A1I4TYB9_PSUAM|nr:hypothetical protein [Pseudonocardia ammonioxydans]SFM81575.1 hypothetical protein SAMN05216207_100371 [Pseudonocardia ammonioxydans]